MGKSRIEGVHSDQQGLCALEALEPRQFLSAATTALGFALGPGDVEPVATAADSAGNTIVLGTFGGVVDFNPRTGRTYNLDGGDSFPGLRSYFVAKYAPSGDPYWVVPVVRGAATGTPPTFQGLATDAQGNVYVSGLLENWFDANPSSRRKRITAAENTVDALVWKLAPDGGLVFAATQHFPSSRTLGIIADETEMADHVVADAAGNIYLTGRHMQDSDGTYRPFLTRFSPVGKVMWTSELPEGEADVLTLDRAGAPALLSHGEPYPSNDILLLRYNLKGRRTADDPLLHFYDNLSFTYAQAHTRPVASFAFDADGNIVVSGSMWSSVDFDPGPAEMVLDGRSSDYGFNAYVAKYTPDRRPLFVRVLGGRDANTLGGGAAIDPTTGNIFVAGSIVGRADLDSSKAGTFVIDSGDPDVNDYDDLGDLFVAKFDGKGRFLTARALSMPATDEVGYAVAVAPSGRVAVLGASSGWPNFQHALAVLLDEIS